MVLLWALLIPSTILVVGLNHDSIVSSIKQSQVPKIIVSSFRIKVVLCEIIRGQSEDLVFFLLKMLKWFNVQCRFC